MDPAGTRPLRRAPADFRLSRFASIRLVARSQGDPERAAELRHHPRPAQRPAPGIRDLAHVYGAGHIGITVTEQKRDLVHVAADA